VNGKYEEEKIWQEYIKQEVTEPKRKI